ncbi:MAG: metal-dependent phosphohydrolase HD sub domain-containing protein [Candidatus Berkelbacteria bacterium Licking1014_7]|uniref:Metal-dependent phosphohydrolase HD sub domain-containing protein n=1 Tax=Candidatus Berkelbacteria bacterium Licking1014_7 TaxID=2017147 RepID=A0A554LHZ3_9BACT|nr:MAG: metal-dependent phosphohydrolase HD sub domain-containing protein [Candidatus Berkelbacteria bacterium Licking1014_7]
MISSGVVKKVKEIVENACKNDKANFFEYNVWENHILQVVQYGKSLAQKMNADEEVVEISALLHDYASIIDQKYRESHHLIGAQLAGKILNRFHYPKDKIRLVKHCILSHRASQQIKRQTIEAEILASADAMAHIAKLPALFYLVYGIQKMDTKNGLEYLRAKINRSAKRLLPEAREMIKDQIEAVRKVLV